MVWVECHICKGMVVAQLRDDNAYAVGSLSLAALEYLCEVTLGMWMCNCPSYSICINYYYYIIINL